MVNVLTLQEVGLMQYNRHKYILNIAILLYSHLSANAHAAFCLGGGVGIGQNNSALYETLTVSSDNFIVLKTYTAFGGGSAQAFGYVGIR